MWRTTARPAVCADDRWYPSRSADLRDAVTQYLEAATAEDHGSVLGLIAPHAGYFFSGHVAGVAYRQVQNDDFATVALIGPDHTGVTSGGLAMPAYSSWRTPLGDVPVDVDLADTICAQLPIRHVQSDGEHSLEVQLPFLQVALGKFNLLPVIMGDQSPSACKTLGEAVAQAVSGRRCLLVASTDLSHFFPDDQARRLDETTLNYVQHFDIEGLAQAISRGEAHACGGGPVVAVMWAAKALGAKQAHLLKYANSADVWSDKRRVVGYAAAVLTS